MKFKLEDEFKEEEKQGEVKVRVKY